MNRAQLRCTGLGKDTGRDEGERGSACLQVLTSVRHTHSTVVTLMCGVALVARVKERSSCARCGVTFR